MTTYKEIAMGEKAKRLGLKLMRNTIYCGKCGKHTIHGLGKRTYPLTNSRSGEKMKDGTQGLYVCLECPEPEPQDKPKIKT